MRRMMHRTRGFTLIELVVGMSVALMVYSVTNEVLLNLGVTRRINAERMALDRDANLALSWLRADVAAAGAGNGSGERRTAGTLGTAPSSLLPAIMALENTRSDPTIASAVSTFTNGESFVLLADVPRPDTNFDGFLWVGDETFGALSPPYTTIPVISELSGRANTAGTPRPGALDPSANCAGVNGAGCPWGLRKVHTANNQNVMQVIYGDGRWQNVVVTTKVVAEGSLNNTHALTLSSAGAPGGEPMLSAPNVPFANARMIQLDRIGYRFRNVTGRNGPRVLERRQCWGRPVPDNGGFGDFGSGCTINTNDTGWQIVARNLTTNSRFTFRDDANPNAVTTTPASIRTVEVLMNFNRVVRLSRTRTKTLSAAFFERLPFRR